MSLTTQDSDLFLFQKQPVRLTSALCSLNQCSAIYSGDLAAASEQITQTAGTVLNLERFGLWLLQENGTELVEVKTYCLTQRLYSQGTRLKIKDYPDHFEALADRHGFALEDTVDGIPEYSSGSPFIANWLRSRQVRALLEVPVYQQGEVVGVLWGEQMSTPRCWQPEDHMFVSAIATLSTLALACQLRGQREAIQQRQQKREAIEREQLEQAWQESQRFIQNILDASTSILYVNDFVSGKNIYVNRWLQVVLDYQPDDLQQLGDCFINQLVHEDDRPAVKAQRHQLKSMGDGEVVEMEYRLRHRSGHWRWLLCRETVFLRDGDGQPVQIFGTATDITDRKQAEVALQEANRELERLANIDGLTQVANRRFFDLYLRQVWESAGHNLTPLSLILCDIDYFKSYNDAYGHQAGDACLEQVAKGIKRAVQRESDLVARYGGEEFAIVLPNTTCHGAQTVASNIQQAIQLLEISHQHSDVAPYITVSLGIATTMHTRALTTDILIAAADENLYRAKYEGRNRFCFEVI